MNTSSALRIFGGGLLGGLMGTAALTCAMLIETRLTGPDQSEEMQKAPAEAVSKTLGLQFNDEQRASQWVHWSYGTSWGIFRGLLALFGMRGFKATLLHAAAITAVASTLLPLLKVAPPPQKTPLPKMASQALNHLLYAVVAGVVLDKLADQKTKES